MNPAPQNAVADGRCAGSYGLAVDAVRLGADGDLQTVDSLRLRVESVRVVQPPHQRGGVREDCGALPDRGAVPMSPATAP